MTAENIQKISVHKCDICEVNSMATIDLSAVKNIKRLLTLISLAAIITITLSGCSSVAVSDTPKVNAGILDLTGWDINTQQTIQLDGQWEFYWDKFLNYSDFQGVSPDLYANVPKTWNEYSIDGKNLPGQGYATYRLHIKTDIPVNTSLGLRPYSFSSAYEIFINDKLVASNGKVSTEASEEVGEYKPQAVFFNTPAKEFDIIIHVSNFQYARGGFWYSMPIGSAEEILSLQDLTMGKEIFLLGALIIISLFYLASYILQREFKYSLFFSCLCLSIAVQLDMVGQYLLPRIIPGMTLNTVITLWYASADWVVLFFILYVHELFRSKFSAAVMRVFPFIILPFQIMYIFTSPVLYTRFADITNLIQVLGIFCAVIIVAIGIRKGSKDGWLNILSMLIVLVTYIHDILFWTNKVSRSFGEIIYIGLFLLIFLQMVVQAERTKRFYEQKTAAELSFLQAQIKPHFLFNALNTFVSISRYDVEQARSLLINFSNYLRRSFDFKDLSQFVPLKNEIEFVRAYVDIEKVQFEERLEVSFEVCDDKEVKVPILIIQPLVENAVMHGVLPKKEGGRIDVSIKRDGKMLIFMVKDNGVGMEPEKLRNALKHKFGSGVGLSNIDSRLKKLYGNGLQIKSIPDMGTEVTWRILINKWNGA